MAIEILSFPVQSGKTTWLMERFAGRPGVFGFVTPGDAEDRVLKNVQTGEAHPYVAAEGVEALEIGRFRLDVRAFERGLGWLQEAAANPECTTLIIDEIGPIEVRQNRGFSPGIDAFLDSVRHRADLRVYLVIRDFLLSEAVEKWGLQDARVNDPGLFDSLPPLTGLVLAGGKSTRMGRDKAFIVRASEPAYVRTAGLLSSIGADPVVSGPGSYPPYIGIPDAAWAAGHGPLSGLLTAAERYPGHGLFVLGVDYPHLDAAALVRLKLAAQLSGRSVCFRQAEGNGPADLEPLVAYYAPHDLRALAEWRAAGGTSLRRFLSDRRACALPHDPRMGVVSVDATADEDLA